VELCTSEPAVLSRFILFIVHMSRLDSSNAQVVLRLSYLDARKRNILFFLYMMRVSCAVVGLGSGQVCGAVRRKANSTLFP
jgi:hypothetical protein